MDNYYQAKRLLDGFLLKQEEAKDLDYNSVRLQFKVKEFKFMVRLIQVACVLAILLRNLDHETSQKLSLQEKLYNFLIILTGTQIIIISSIQSKTVLNLAVQSVNILVSMLCFKSTFMRMRRDMEFKENPM